MNPNVPVLIPVDELPPKQPTGRTAGSPVPWAAVLVPIAGEGWHQILDRPWKAVAWMTNRQPVWATQMGLTVQVAYRSGEVFIRVDSDEGEAE
jgi:hypothetical protein